MDVEEVDGGDAEAAQAALARGAAGGGRGVDGEGEGAGRGRPRGGVRVLLGNLAPGDAELGAEEEVGAAVRVQAEPGADEVLAVAVGGRRVPEGGAEGPGAVEDGEAVLVGAVGGGGGCVG